MILVIQTNVTGQLSVWLVQAGRIVQQEHRSVEWHGSDQALPLIDRIFRRAKITVTDVRGLIVVRGPGSFTAVRIGLIIANTVSQLLRLPVHGVVKGKTLSDKEVLALARVRGKKNARILPWYGKAPNITRPRQVKAKR